MTVENHIALPIPPDPYDDLKPRREENCCICDRTGYLVAAGSWYEDTCVDTDEDGPYVAGSGSPLYDAADTPSGWVCGLRCRSQAMYDRADDAEKEALKQVRDACYVLLEYGKRARKSANRDMASETSEALIDEAGAFLEAVADDGDNMPDWCISE